MYLGDMGHWMCRIYGAMEPYKVYTADDFKGMGSHPLESLKALKRHGLVKRSGKFGWKRI